MSRVRWGYVLGALLTAALAWPASVPAVQPESRISGIFAEERAEGFSIQPIRHRGGMPHGSMMHGMGEKGAGVCPQPRSTPDAPDEFLKLKNPLEQNWANVLAGKEIFQFEAQPTACKICHGDAGNGLGIMAQSANPMPRNFTCKEVMKDISDGQMFYIITHGSQGTVMPAFPHLSKEQVWQLITYIRSLGK